MNIEWERDIIQTLVKELLQQGLRVFLSKTDTYGFFSNQEGTRVISFSVYYISIRFSGNYITDRPQSTGCGWIIRDIDTAEYHQLLCTPAPYWALSEAKVIRYITVADKLTIYGRSSKYREIFEEDICNQK